MFAHLSLPTAPAVNAQSCPPVAVDGGSTIAAGATIDGTTQEVTHEMVVPKWTTLRLDAIATVAGECSSYFEQCNPSPCTCVLNSTYPRTINHISMWMDVTTSGALNGQYTVGYVYGLNPNGTTAFYPVLDTQASNSTGPVYETLSIPGTYRFSIRAVLNNGICNGLPEYTSTITFTVFVGDADESVNNGPDADSCPSGIAPPSAVGEPVNVTNGNVFIEQTDYRLPGFGAGLEVTRTYNSKWQRAGIFGYGWSTAFDESITPYGTTLVRLNLADGRAVYLGAAAVGEPFLPKQPVNFPGQVVKKCRQYLHANVQRWAGAPVQCEWQNRFLCGP